MLSKFLSFKGESITSSLYSIMLWTAKLPISLLKIPNQPPPPCKKDDLQVGLKILTHSESKQPHGLSIVHCHTITKTSKRSMFRCSMMDDLIGSESGDSMSSNVEEHLKGVVDEAQPLNNRTRLRYRSTALTRQYPPPMGRHPWVLKREYCDGRLIVRAERVKHHQHLEVRRENGRLQMKFVPVHEDVEFNEQGGEGTQERCDEFEEELGSEAGLENESGPCGVSYAGWIVMEMEVPIGTWGVQDSPPLRPMTTVM